MYVSGVKCYEGAQTRMDREQKLINNATFEVSKRLALRFPRRDILDAEIEFCSIEASEINDGSLGSKKSNDVYSNIIKKQYTAQFKYQNNNYYLHTEDNLYFYSDELKVANYYKPETLKILRKKLQVQTGMDIDLKDVIIESYYEKDVLAEGHTTYNPRSETIYLLEVQFENNIYEFCFNKDGKTRNFNHTNEKK